MKISSGSVLIDNLLDGGFETGIITTIYGPAGSGKTNICLLTSIRSVFDNKKIIYVDTDSSFSVERLKQLTKDYEKILDKTIFLKPISFDEQKKCFDKLRDLTKENIGLIIIDSISMLYRLELGKTNDVYDVNKELGLQLSYLNEVARKKDIPILITNQVYTDFQDNHIKMVGGDLLKYGSKCLIELKKFGKGVRQCIVKKHRSIEEDKSFFFKIIENGIEKFTPP